MFTKAYLEPSLISTIKLFCKKLLVAVNYFCTSAALYIFDWVLNMPLVHQTHHAKGRRKIVLF